MALDYPPTSAPAADGGAADGVDLRGAAAGAASGP